MTLCCLLFLPFKLKFFAPFLILVYYQKSFPISIWVSLLCGLSLDLLSPAKFGLYAAAYSLTTLLLYSQRFNFFADKFMTLPMMTFAFSILSTLLEAALFFIFGKPLFFSLSWLISELLLMPLADALYSFLFLLPFYRSRYTRRI